METIEQEDLHSLRILNKSYIIRLYIERGYNGDKVVIRVDDRNLAHKAAW